MKSLRDKVVGIGIYRPPKGELPNILFSLQLIGSHVDSRGDVVVVVVVVYGCGWTPSAKTSEDMRVS